MITNEDNMILMARYEDNHFDLAIVDPPYGIERFKKRKYKNWRYKRKL
jgi:site-specific DNA-methyltransferase (adenine-specific)